MPKVARTRQSRTSSRVGGKDPTENPSSTAANSRPKRAVLGDVSNRRSTRLANKPDGGSEIGKVEKKTATTRIRSGRAGVAKSESANDKSAATTATSKRNSRSGTESEERRRSLRSHAVGEASSKRSSRSRSRTEAKLENDQTATATSKRTSKNSNESEKRRLSLRSSSGGNTSNRSSRSSTRTEARNNDNSEESSSRSSRASTKATANLRGKAAKRTRGDEAAAAAPKAKKPRKNTKAPKKPSKPSESVGSRVRSRSSSRGSVKKNSGKEGAKGKVVSSRRGRTMPRSPCSDFLAKTDYELVRKPFDASKYTAGIASYDNENRDDVLEVSNYVTDIFQRLYNAETITRPPMYMDTQRDINARMRAILVDWLVEVHMKFRLVPETLYLCVNIIDRYCNSAPVQRSKLQLVGVTALLVACKYEEIYPPEVRDCVYITDRAYSRQEVLDMEQDIVQQLEFKMTVPTAYPFLQRFLLVTKAPEMTKIAANYYMERTLQEHDILKYRPSLVAAAAVSLALNNPEIRERDELPEQRPGIPSVLLEYTGFQTTHILECAELIAEKVGEEITTASRRQLVAVKRKYDNRKYQNVSTEVLDPDIDDIVTA